MFIDFRSFLQLSLLAFFGFGGCLAAAESKKRAQTYLSMSSEIVEYIYSTGNYSFISGTTPSKISSKFSPPLQRSGIF
ncbi:hypothetical protein B0E34_05285 [Chryseobacterium mucoviscidosis]|uniref:Uncharacterized protein n=1 Tax=Chryseobacterium mucoviscidosis TaxID=1945581 RepID=A0A202C6P3_9FLAO|nr:hypothetical protein B0E34_05285 [Chryseobacterium mucoviscidosis]